MAFDNLVTHVEYRFIPSRSRTRIDQRLPPVGVNENDAGYLGARLVFVQPSMRSEAAGVGIKIFDDRVGGGIRHVGNLPETQARRKHVAPPIPGGGKPYRWRFRWR